MKGKTMGTVSLTKRITGVVMALVLALALVPVVAWSGAVPQASADAQAEIAQLLPAVTENETATDDADAGLVAQAANEEVMVSGAAYYNYAHQVLAIVNKERKALGRAEITLDYELTEAAMQRAAETAIFYNHTRPDGSEAHTAIPSAKRGMTGENIALGQKTPAQVMQDWFTNEKDIWEASAKSNTFNGKALPTGWKTMSAYDLSHAAPEFYGAVGHYLNIINPDFKSMGVGCFAQGEDLFYWTQVFSNASGSGNVFNDNRNTTRTIQINYGVCGNNQGFNLNTTMNDMKVLNVGSTYKMSYCMYNGNSQLTNDVYGIIDPKSVTWTSSNPKVCTVSNGEVAAVGAGTATITARLKSGRQLTHQWTVSQSVANLPTPSIPNQTYTGSPIEPNPTVTANGVALVRGTDYTVAYTYNTNVGVARMIITGIGKYTGTKNVDFSIVPANITAVELSQTRFTYDGYEKRPGITVKCGDRVLSEGTEYRLSFPADMKSIGTHTITVSGMGNYTGSMGATIEIATASGLVPSEPDPDDPGLVMFRLYNPNSGEHFYTASELERDHLIEVGWDFEGNGWTAPTKGGDSVYRLYNPYAGEHHYTPSAGERDALVAAGWNDEGIGWQTGGMTPLYRLYNPNAYANNHHYTTEAGERDILLSIGWQDEGTGWFGIGK